MQSFYYWSGTSYAGNPNLAWDVYLYDGFVHYYSKDYYDYVWPVRFDN